MEKKLYEKQEIYDPAAIAELSEHYAAILRLLGEDPTREGLLKTPERVAKAMAFMTKGYAEDPRDILLSAMFREEYRQMVLVRDIEVYSLCEHHMLPFYGKAHVAYIPDGYITGLSKVARVVECFARRLQVQERLTVQIRDCIQEALHPLGVAVVIEASHMCMQMRGVEKQESHNGLTTGRRRNRAVSIVRSFRYGNWSHSLFHQWLLSPPTVRDRPYLT